jgi:geranylgeranyl pyrophosphate synthase
MNGPTPEEAVLDEVLRLASAQAVTPEQRLLMRAAIAEVRDRLRGSPPGTYLRCVRLPLAVHLAVRGDEAAAFPVATALTALHAGLNVLDDVMDGDPRPWWVLYRPAEVLLAAFTLIAALPQLILSRIDAPPRTIAAMQREVARAGMTMSAGQQRDIAMTGAARVTTRAVEASVRAKSGAAHALATMLAARLAGARSADIRQYGRIGRAIGTAAQLASDCHDVFLAPDSRDLRHGTRTLPVALYLESLRGGRREGFLALLQQARTDAGARATVRMTMREARVLEACAVIIEVYCHEAHTALDRVRGQGSGIAALRRLIDDHSMVRIRKEE